MKVYDASIIKRPSKVFLSGKMTGVPHYNFPKFDEIESRLKDIGIDCVNPANISRKYKLLDILNDTNTYDEMIKDQMIAMMECDTLMLIGENWNHSVGTRNELKVAIARDMQIMLESELTKLENNEI